jgi:DNA/RNA-binding domain of Phe-tRNA-synthetase-like protein
MAYRALGKYPSRDRGSQESLLRRVLQGQGLYTINTVVYINNLVPLESSHSVGCCDCSHIHFPVIFRIGHTGESYKGIGKQMINLERRSCPPSIVIWGQKQSPPRSRYIY